MPRKERESLWRRYAEDMLRKQKSALDQEEEKHMDAKGRSSGGLGRFSSGSDLVFPMQFPGGGKRMVQKKQNHRYMYQIIDPLISNLEHHSRQFQKKEFVFQN